MNTTKLNNTLSALILEFGFSRVERALRKNRPSTRKSRDPEKRDELSHKPNSVKHPKAKLKKSALEYAEQMKLDPEKQELVTALAAKFERKEFLPTFVDVDYFCKYFGIVTPASRSRVSSIPRVFKYLASMESQDIRKIIEDGMFSGPARLGPIAEAILRNGRAQRAEYTE